eukprot:311168_1
MRNRVRQDSNGNVECITHSLHDKKKQTSNARCKLNYYIIIAVIISVALTLAYMFKFKLVHNKLIMNRYTFSKFELSALVQSNLSITKPISFRQHLKLNKSMTMMVYPPDFDVYVSKRLKNGDMWEPWTIQCIINILNSCIQTYESDNKITYMDIGANIGSLLIPISKIFDNKINIIALEGSIGNSAVLKSNLILNDLNNIILYAPFAISDVWNKTVYFQTVWNNKGANYVEINNKKQKGIGVETTTLDHIFDENIEIMKNVCMIKIDVEGFEMKALRGGTNMLSNNPPCVIFIELIEKYLQRQSKISIHEVIGFLTSFGYTDIRKISGPFTKIKQNDIDDSIEAFFIHRNCHLSLF